MAVFACVVAGVVAVNGVVVVVIVVVVVVVAVASTMEHARDG